MNTLAPGIYPGLPMAQYLALDAIGSTQLDWLGISPLHFDYMRRHPAKQSDAFDLGAALHMAVLEPERFTHAYAIEPDPESIAPLNAKPRATKVYRDAVAAIEADGKFVLREDVAATIAAMTRAVVSNRLAARLLRLCEEREVSILWEREGHLCRGRSDMLGVDVTADLKSTRSLRDFSPWAITKYGYHVQQAHYVDGLARNDRPVRLVYLIAIESSPPYDVGVFEVPDDVLEFGRRRCEYLLEQLGKCERAGVWPGQFPTLQTAQITDAAAQQILEEEVA